MRPKLARLLAAAVITAAGLISLSSSSSPAEAAVSALASSPPTGALSPTNLQSAYDLPTGMGATSTVAVVTPYDDPKAESDMAAYRTEYGLAACNSDDGCFSKVNQTGGTTYPTEVSAWSPETSESLDAISAVCPNCNIILVEANSSAISDLGTAENEAVALGAEFIDNTFGLPEDEIGAAETTYDTEYFNHPGVAITAPSGDSGYGTVEYPAASQYVTAVGGTVLTSGNSGNRSWTENVWSNSGSGCSLYEPKPSWQTDTGCSGRTLNDVAAATNIAYYDSPTVGGWATGASTVVSAAIIAATYALAGNPAPGSYPASYMYTHPGAFWSITGSNGSCGTSSSPLYYLCNAGSGYNGPAGMGVPFADTAFSTVGAKPAEVTGTNGTTWAFVTSSAGAIEASSLPSGSSTWSTLSSLGGGTWSGYPGAMVTTSGNILVFGRQGGNLYYDQLTSGSTTWSGWTELGNPGNGLVGTPTAVEDKSGDIWVFTRDSVSGHVWSDEKPNGSTTWSGFTSLTGTVPNDITAVVGGGGTMTLFSIGNNSAVYQDNLSPGGSWTGWQELSGVTATGIPVIIIDASGTRHVFVRQLSSGALMTDTVASGSSTWSGWSSIGGTWYNNLIALAASGGTVWVFGVGYTTDVYKNSLSTAGSWAGWTSVGSPFEGVPAFSQDTSSNFHLLDVTTAGVLEANQVDSGSSTWLGWATIGGSLAGS
jgi:hypothetical protein